MEFNELIWKEIKVIERVLKLHNDLFITILKSNSDAKPETIETLESISEALDEKYPKEDR